MIVGFDHDDTRIFKAQHEFLRQTDIMHSMVGMLSAIPKTPLHARLRDEGRLDRDDEQPFGTNVIPLNMTRDELRDGYVDLTGDLYGPDFYFERLENLFITRKFNWSRARNACWRRHPWQKLKSQSVDAVLAAGLFLRLMKNIPDRELRRVYRRRMATMVRRRLDPSLLFICVIKCAMHYHHYTMSKEMGEQRALVNTF